MTKGELLRFIFFGYFLTVQESIMWGFFGYGTCARLGLKSGDS